MKGFFEPKSRSTALIYLFRKGLDLPPSFVTAKLPKFLKASSIGTDYLSFRPEVPFRRSVETPGTIIATPGKSLDDDRKWFQEEASNSGIIQWGTYTINGDIMEKYLKEVGAYLSDNGEYWLLHKEPSEADAPHKLMIGLLKESIVNPKEDPLDLLKSAFQPAATKSPG